MIRGRVASDVYSIGRDAMGKRQQVVRSLAEVVSNPRTLSQMRSRMIMSTVMQALGALKVIVDHSFDNVSGVQPNLSEFIRRNYALAKADAIAHAGYANTFGMVKYGEKYVRKPHRTPDSIAQQKIMFNDFDRERGVGAAFGTDTTPQEDEHDDT